MESFVLESDYVQDGKTALAISVPVKIIWRLSEMRFRMELAYLNTVWVALSLLAFVHLRI